MENETLIVIGVAIGVFGAIGVMFYAAFADFEFKKKPE